jgi:hypothetical protein
MTSISSQGEEALSRTDMKAGSLYSLWSSDDDKGEMNLEDDEDMASATEEDESPQLEWWELAERQYE